MWSYKQCPSGFWAVFFDGSLWDGALASEGDCIRLIDSMMKYSKGGAKK